MSFLQIRNVSHCFFAKENAKLILENMSLQVEEGEFISILGPSGCGKTTLLSIIAGLLDPIEGIVFLDGEPITTKTSSMGYMLQQDYLFPWKTIEENIMLGLHIRKIYDEQTKEHTLQLLKQVGLHDVEQQYPRELSGGMRQRAALVRTLATDPKILLLDEPFSALDYQTKLKLEDLVFSLLRKYKKTSLLVTHDIEEAIAMSDRIYLLQTNPGKIAKTFIVPESIRSLSPLESRHHHDFPSLFQNIWKELERLG
ncbi:MULTISPECIES: ABC transporter ATP-binding protein [Bacillus cereus group]|uniref:Spermidine/putrescine ABC transporter ATP-binding protein n=1 Tax=Bacillus thuringiensis serovar mexicanensis TaxID=180868 RepID=A0A242W4U1_BACTU|nr:MULTISPECIES: ABC transporter ATP-binding protein [Bacillus cereus group]MEB9669115.1 ABC transporter ATP-binding protein [Bacillus anthracis]OTW46345.1 spermidine/putrescine ABC transporter ATP-binding protein [Bacillus thuringiensis serovar mexicanensis]OTW99051.1 spermidine/putrescine ABC transporter ATP-binding protein [Bacillus thuringiensis serovar monterrey]